MPDTVLIHRLFIDDDAVSRTVGYHFDTAAQFIAASGAQAPAAAAVGCGEGRLTGFEPGYGDRVVGFVEPLRRKAFECGTGIPAFRVPRHELCRQQTTLSVIADVETLAVQ